MSKRRIIELSVIAFAIASVSAPATASGPGAPWHAGTGYVPAPTAETGPYGSHMPAPVSMMPQGIDTEFRVDLDHTGVLRLPMAASAVVVGNPDVADVAVHSTDTLLVLGRSYGTTNVLAMDAVGRVIGDYTVTVGSHASQARVRIYEGITRQTFSCSPNCSPAPELGDDQEFVSTYRPAAPVITNGVASQGSSVNSPMPAGSQFAPNSFQNGPEIGDLPQYSYPGSGF